MIRAWTFAGLVGAFACVGTGCVTSQPDPLSPFPLGIYAPGPPSNFPLLRAVGFNLVVAAAREDVLDSARKYDIRVLATPGSHAGPAFDAARAKQLVRDFDSHPALWAWYLVDEPDMHGISPDWVAGTRDFLRRAGARKPTALVLYNGFESRHYAGIADITMIDRYPIPWAPLASFDQHVRLTRHATPEARPVLAVIQAFDWRYYPRLLGEPGPTRAPTWAELRAMTYCALVQGVQGILYYAFDDGRWRILEHPESWEALRRVAEEVSARAALFQAAHVWWPWRQAIQYTSADRFNEALESSVVFALVHNPFATAAVPAGRYIVAVNTTGRQHTIKIQLPPGSQAVVAGALPLLGEERTVSISEKGFSDMFDGYAVHVYGPL